MSDATASLLCVTTSVATFTTVMPKMSDVRKSIGNPGVTNDVRMGEITASVIAVGTGLLASSLTKSKLPLMVSLLSVIALVVMYESVLKSTPQEKTNGTVYLLR